MKNISIQKVIWISFLLCQLVACSNIKKQPPVSVEENFLNNQILLRAPNFGNTYKTSDPIMLELKYNSNNEIKFPNNYNAKIYEKTNNGWIKIEEEPTITLEPDEIVLAPNIELPPVQIVILFPDLPDMNRKYTLRVYVFGEMNSSGEIKEVAAYADFTLHP